MARLFTFAGRACLAAVVAIGALTLPVAAANAASDEEKASASLDFNENDGSLNIEWSGPIVPGMADYLRTALDTYGPSSHRVVLFLNSAGGQVEEGDHVIHVLTAIRQMHRLVTVVLEGDLCASMCIPIFLQGDDRLAARTSNWIFHQAAKQGANRKERKEKTLHLFGRYYVPAGVSTHWLEKSIMPVIKGANLWQTGGDLISEKTGIITYPMEKWTEQLLAPSAAEAKLEGAGRRRSHAPQPVANGAPDHAGVETRWLRLPVP
jgi:hypothetical protein